MKRLFIQLLALSMSVMTGCSTDPVADRIWCGDLYRMEDGERLSEVCMKLSGDTLRIYSNAIFGVDNECLFRQMNQKSDYLFVDATGDEFPMKFTYAADQETAETLLVEGPDYRMVLHPASDETFAPELLAFYKHRPVPSQAALYFSGRWTGDIIRSRDGQRLSAVCVEYRADTLKVYANAIFGKQNEVLLCTGFHDGSYRYANGAGTEFRLRPARPGENISLFGSDFLMELEPLQGDWQAARAFYKSQNVPRNADSYLFGTYVGRAKGGVPMANTLGVLFGMQSGFMDMQIIATLSFSEGNRCKCTTEILWDDPQISTMLIMSGKDIREKSSKIYKYKVEGNRVILDQKGGTYYIQADGSLFLPGANDGYARLDDMILRKQ